MKRDDLPVQPLQGGVVTEDMSVTPGSNNDMLIPEALEPDVTLDWCKWAQTGQISS